MLVDLHGHCLPARGPLALLTAEQCPRRPSRPAPPGPPHPDARRVGRDGRRRPQRRVPPPAAARRAAMAGPAGVDRAAGGHDGLGLPALEFRRGPAMRTASGPPLAPPLSARPGRPRRPWLPACGQTRGRRACRPRGGSRRWSWRVGRRGRGGRRPPRVGGRRGCGRRVPAGRARGEGCRERTPGGCGFRTDAHPLRRATKIPPTSELLTRRVAGERNFPSRKRKRRASPSR